MVWSIFWTDRCENWHDNRVCLQYINLYNRVTLQYENILNLVYGFVLRMAILD